ncbi:MAG: signal peptidase I [Firmicutes bacterium]|nr:signal peptidase I [Bacillota bacterium]
MSSRWWRELCQLLLALFAASLIFFAMHAYLAEARVITSGSMLPTIQVGDRVLMEKVTCHFAMVHRQDIIVFTPPPAAQAKEDYIKRVIGLPGAE